MDREVIEQKLESLRRCLHRISERCPSDPATLGRDPEPSMRWPKQELSTNRQRSRSRRAWAFGILPCIITRKSTGRLSTVLH